MVFPLTISSGLFVVLCVAVSTGGAEAGAVAPVDEDCTTGAGAAICGAAAGGAAAGGAAIV